MCACACITCVCSKFTKIGGAVANNLFQKRISLWLTSCVSEWERGRSKTLLSGRKFKLSVKTDGGGWMGEELSEHWLLPRTDFETFEGIGCDRKSVTFWSSARLFWCFRVVVRIRLCGINLKIIHFEPNWEGWTFYGKPKIPAQFSSQVEHSKQNTFFLLARDALSVSLNGHHTKLENGDTGILHEADVG
jgi:hypothetical protein